MKKLILFFGLILAANLFAGTGLTYKQMTAGEFADLNMTLHPLANGNNRWINNKTDRVILELIGKKSDLDSVSLTIIAAASANNEAEKVKLLLSFATALAFLKNIDNTWDDAGKFFYPAVTKIADGSKQECTTRRKLRICVNDLLSLGLLNVNAKPEPINHIKISEANKNFEIDFAKNINSQPYTKNSIHIDPKYFSTYRKLAKDVGFDYDKTYTYHNFWETKNAGYNPEDDGHEQFEDSCGKDYCTDQYSWEIIYWIKPDITVIKAIWSDDAKKNSYVKLLKLGKGRIPNLADKSWKVEPKKRQSKKELVW